MELPSMARETGPGPGGEIDLAVWAECTSMRGPWSRRLTLKPVLML